MNEGSSGHLRSCFITLKLWSHETAVLSSRPVSAGSGSGTMKRLQLQAVSTQPKLETSSVSLFFWLNDTNLFRFPLSRDILLSV